MFGHCPACEYESGASLSGKFNILRKSPDMIDGMIFRWLFLARKIPKIPPAHPETLHK
jgi:hypothetical protein